MLDRRNIVADDCVKFLALERLRWQTDTGLSIKLNKDKTKCRNIHIGFNLAIFLCLQKYAKKLF